MLVFGCSRPERSRLCTSAVCGGRSVGGARRTDGFRLELLAAGYSASTVGPYVRLLAVLSGWLADNGLMPGDLTDEVAARFAATRRTLAPRAGGLGLRPLLAYLRAQGVAPAAVAVTYPYGEVLAAFTRYLTVERRLAPLTVTGTVGTIRRLLGTTPCSPSSRTCNYADPNPAEWLPASVKAPGPGIVSDPA